MNAREGLTALLRGERHEALLHNCRFAAFGQEHYGEEAALAALRRDPREASDGARWIESAHGLALFDDDLAVIADVYDGHIGRAWRLGPGAVEVGEPAIAVPFDPDMKQARGLTSARREDHPELADGLWPAVLGAGDALVTDAETNSYRARAFLVRAFGAGVSAASLWALTRWSNDRQRVISTAMVAGFLSGERISWVHDGGEPDNGWRTRF